MAINFDNALGIHAEALKVSTQRAEMLATNMANADTPGFKATDIDFREALKAATAGQSGNLNTTHQKHIPLTGNGPDNPQVQYRTTVQDSLDGNTVDEQIEQAQFMQNAVQYQATLEFLGSKFQGLTKALRGD